MRTWLALSAVFPCFILTLGCSDDEPPSSAQPGGSGAGAGPTGSAGGGQGGQGGQGGEGGSGPPACGEGQRQLPSGWCWEAPRTQTMHLTDIDGTPDGSSILAVGEIGASLRRSGGAWQPLETGTEAHLHGVWHPAPDFALAVGDHGTLLRFDGQAWSVMATPTKSNLLTVWGAAQDDVWIGGEADGDGGIVLHWDGTTFERVDFTEGNHWGEFRRIRGRAANDVYAMGDGQYHFDGVSWHVLPLPGQIGVGHTADEVVLLDDARTLVRFPVEDEFFIPDGVYELVGDGWVPRPAAGDYWRESALFRGADGSAYAMLAVGDVDNLVLQRLEGDAFVDTGDEPAGPIDVAWSSPASGETWGVGRSGVLVGGAEGAWAQADAVEAFPLPATQYDFIDDIPRFLDGPDEDHLWLVTFGVVAQRQSDHWAVTPLPVDFASGFAVDPAGRPYLSASNGDIWTRDADDWVLLSTAPAGAEYLSAASPDDLVTLPSFAEPLRFDGQAWLGFDECRSLQDGTTSSFLYALGVAREPNGPAWAFGPVAYRLGNDGSCGVLVAPDLGSDTLIGVAWAGGKMWALGREGGHLYERVGDVLVDRGHPAPQVGEGAETFADSIHATPDGLLRVAYLVEVSPDSYTYVPRVVTVDPATGKAIGEALVAPAEGITWLAGDETMLAIQGGVLRHPGR